MLLFYFAGFNQCKDYIVFEFYFLDAISRSLHPERLRLIGGVCEKILIIIKRILQISLTFDCDLSHMFA